MADWEITRPNKFEFPRYSHTPDPPQLQTSAKKSGIALHLQFVLMEQENKYLKEEIIHLNRSRQYYQHELISELRKYEELDTVHENKIKEIRREYEEVISGYLDEIDQKNHEITKLKDVVEGLKGNTQGSIFLDHKEGDENSKHF